MSSSFHASTVDWLGCWIAAGQVRPGDSLRVEADLGEQLGVSRTVIREAIKTLVAKGMLKQSQIDPSYDGSPARFVGDPAIVQQGFANYVRAAKALPEDRFGEGKTVNRILEASGYGHCREHLPALKELRGKASG